MDDKFAVYFSTIQSIFWACLARVIFTFLNVDVKLFLAVSDLYEVVLVCTGYGAVRTTMARVVLAFWAYLVANLNALGD